MSSFVEIFVIGRSGRCKIKRQCLHFNEIIRAYVDYTLSSNVKRIGQACTSKQIFRHMTKFSPLTELVVASLNENVILTK